MNEENKQTAPQNTSNKKRNIALVLIMLACVFLIAGTCFALGNSSFFSQDAQQQNSTSQQATIDVFVSVSSSAADNRVTKGEAVSLPENATAYDALCATGLSVESASSSYGTYVKSIGGLAEKEFGATSGWMYSVNGTSPEVACTSYVLKEGDKVEWSYVV